MYHLTAQDTELQRGQMTCTVSYSLLRGELSLEHYSLFPLSLTDSPKREMTDRATYPMHQNYWACALELGSSNYWAHVSQLLKPEHPGALAPQQEKQPQWEALALKLESSHHSPQLEKRPSTAKNKYINKNLKKRIKVSCSCGSYKATFPKSMQYLRQKEMGFEQRIKTGFSRTWVQFLQYLLLQLSVQMTSTRPIPLTFLHAFNLSSSPFSSSLPIALSLLCSVLNGGQSR